MTVKIASGSKCSDIDARHSAPSRTCATVPSSRRRSHTSATRWYGPVATAVRYVDWGGVLANVTVASSPSPATVRDASTAPDRISQPLGAVTTKVNRAFRSGCSKLANTRRASVGSKWV